MLYILAPLPPAEACRVTALLVGRLALPAQLLGAAEPLAAPHFTTWAVSGEGCGGGAMRSRNNLIRAGGDGGGGGGGGGGQ